MTIKESICAFSILSLFALNYMANEDQDKLKKHQKEQDVDITILKYQVDVLSESIAQSKQIQHQ